MIRTIAFAAVFLVLLTEISSSQELVQIRSGEHEDFSRLVFDTNPLPVWRLDQKEDGYALYFDKFTPPFDSQQIYKFIPKSRLLSLTPLPKPFNGFFLSVAKDHRVDAFETERGLLVVDIKRGVRDPISPNQMTETEAQTFKMGSKSVEPFKEPQIFVLQPPSLGQETRARQNIKGLGKADVATELSRKPKTVPVFRLPGVRVLEAQDRLEAEMIKARNQGLIEGGFMRPQQKSGAAQRQSSASNPQSNVATPIVLGSETTLSEMNLLDHLNLQAQTVYDRDKPKKDDTQITEVSQQNCLPDSLFELENWADPKPEEQISMLRRKLFGEFDKVNKNTLKKLVKLYVFLGLGIEARALLASYPGMIDSEMMLAEMSFLIEDGGTLSESLLASQANCSGRSVMWAILARPEIPIGEVPNGKLISSTFALLPAGLRRRIGPRLGTRFLEAGLIEDATRVVSLVARIAGPDNAEFKLLAARLDIARGNTSLAKTALWELTAGIGMSADEARLILARMFLKDGKAVPRELIFDIASRAFEMRGSPKGKSLRRIEILSWASRQRQSLALEILTHEAVINALGPTAAREIVNKVFLSFDLADLENLARTFFEYRYLLDDTAAMDRARNHMARGLMHAGLPKAALSVIEISRMRYQAEDRLLVSEIFLALEQPDMAIKAVEGVDNPQVHLLNAKALAQKRDFGRAFDRSGASSANDFKDNLAWRAGRWKAVAKSGMISRREAASFAQKSGEYGKESEGTLQELFRLSQEAKDVLARNEQLLNDHPLP